MNLSEVVPLVLTNGNRDVSRLATDLRAIGKPQFHFGANKGCAADTEDAIREIDEWCPGKHILLCEDDIAISPKLKTAIESIEWPLNVAAIVFCDMREIPESAAPGLYLRSPRGCNGYGWWGNQCILFHAEAIKTLVEADWSARRVRGFSGSRVTYDLSDDRNAPDIKMSMIIASNCERNLYAVHVPSLAIHMGVTSEWDKSRVTVIDMGERWTRNIDPSLFSERDALLGKIQPNHRLRTESYLDDYVRVVR